jgi:uncharacterized NAD-dependent epimerase/dehydratase family protein
MLELPQPYLLFLGDVTERGFAKTAFGLRDWVPELCVGECALPEASVSLGLCHEATRERVLGLEDYPLPGLEEAIDLHLRLARRTNPRVRCAGVSLNTSGLEEGVIRPTLAVLSTKLKLPVADPLRPGEELDRLVSSCLAIGS